MFFRNIVDQLAAHARCDHAVGNGDAVVAMATVAWPRHGAVVATPLRVEGAHGRGRPQARRTVGTIAASLAMFLDRS